MILLKPQLLEGMDSSEGLKDALKQAIRLEHATIPAYLYALYSIKTGSNIEISDRIKRVVIEEMTHMSLACNILNAIGGSPTINDPALIPDYPKPLPGSVEDQLKVPLARFSLDLVRNVFMVIEEPEKPLNFPDKPLAARARVTIGQFYGAIKQGIIDQGKSIFVGHPERQLKGPLLSIPGEELIAVMDVDSAVKAIEIIVEQGEGTSQSPNDQDNDLAHYYRFAEISHGHELERNPDAPPGAPADQQFRYSGKKVPFDKNGVWPVIENPKASSYKPGSPARLACDDFNATYTAMLDTLQETFNGAPDKWVSAWTQMTVLRQQATNLVQIELGDGTNAGPSFESRK